MSHMKSTFEVIKKMGDDRKAGSVVCKDGLLFLCVCLMKKVIIRYAGLLKGNRKGIVS
ncbi:unnamed protein product [Ixodes pacificus]